MIKAFANNLVKRIHGFIRGTSRDLDDRAPAKRGVAARAALDEAQELRNDAGQAVAEAERDLQNVEGDSLEAVG